MGSNTGPRENLVGKDKPTSEESMWGRVRRALSGLDPVRVENRCETGTPDVNYVEGWIELKIGEAPKRKGIFKIDHYTSQQRTWAVRRAHSGGRVFLFLKVSNEWILLKGEVAAQYLNHTTLEELKKKAIKIWKIKLNDQELRELLTN